MNILLLTHKNNETFDIDDYLKEEGHHVETTSTKAPFDLPKEEFGDEWDLGISVHYSHILKKEHIEKFTHGVINIHPSLLPHGRGADPCLWSLFDGKPCGITIHWVDEGIDTGNILFQLPVEPSLLETGQSLYSKLISYYKHIFPVFWMSFHEGIKQGNKPLGKVQPKLDQTYKTAKRSHLPVKVGHNTRVSELLALYHREWDNAYVLDEFGNKYIVKLQIEREYK